MTTSEGGTALLYEYLEVDHPAAHVACVTLNHPARLNAINGIMLQELDRAVRHITQDDNIRAWLLKGSPRQDGRPCFSAGVDLKAIDEGKTIERHLGPRITDAIDDMLKPSIALIDGVASTGAVELALACDFRLVGEQAQISDWHLKHLGSGLGAWGSPTRWLELVGATVTKEVILTGKVLDAVEAFRTGFATVVVNSTQLFEAGLSMASTIAAMDPRGVRSALAHIQQSGAPARDHSLRLAHQLPNWFGPGESFVSRARMVSRREL
jgi:enoyl-CoA hydratase/carnithine racemase